MAYRKTRQNSITFKGGQNQDIGAFAASDVQSGVKVISPDGTIYWIVVDNAGVVSTQTSAP